MSAERSSNALAVQVERRIFLVRGQRVMLDFDLAELYGVETRALKQAVRRNLDRFPPDFMFELSAAEIQNLVSQTVIPTRGKLGGAIPMAFTEQGVAMLSSVLRSPRALKVNIAIMRTFVRLREMLLSNADLARKLAALENKYDAQFKVVFDAIRELMQPPTPPRREWSGGAAATWPVKPRRIAGELSGSERDTNRVSRSRKSNARIWRAEAELTCLPCRLVTS